MAVKTEYYINHNEMTYWTIISIGQGKVHPKLANMFILLIDRMMFKTAKYMGYDDKMDSRNNAYLQLALKYNRFNYKKYENAFNFFSEVLKRSLAESFNTIVYRTQGANKEKCKFISLSDAFQY